MERRRREAGVASLAICEVRVRGTDFIISLVDLARESHAVDVFI